MLRMRDSYIGIVRNTEKRADKCTSALLYGGTGKHAIVIRLLHFIYQKPSDNYLIYSINGKIV